MSIILGVIFALSAALLWAVSSLLARVSMRGISSLSLNVLRLFMGALLYFVVLAIYGLPPLGTRGFLILVISALIGFTLGDWLFFESIKILGVSRAALLVTPYPILTMLLAHIFLGRPLTLRIGVGAFLIILAVTILMGESREGRLDPRGVLFSAGAQVLWAAAIVMTDWLVTGNNPLVIAGLRISFGALGALIFVPKILPDVRGMRPRNWGTVFLVAFLGTFLGHCFFTTAIKEAGSSVATPAAESSPILAALLAVLFLNEPLTRRLLYAIILTGVGIILISTG
ncbi:DMT family transporter [Thermococcus camini]|uniref:Permeases of the drug/metabolite transporter (DMT) superfamily n=1 Tax=Thermococcus camini TaxID=2016373 RepID=A0A7G2D9K8_9EURY|nr:DMT family transporter [Thermococcus camini]CAD5244925.1 Permeases of the drug/metabolite transporter (DMT) superfamily [Thermococcus camini]